MLSCETLVAITFNQTESRPFYLAVTDNKMNSAHCFAATNKTCHAKRSSDLNIQGLLPQNPGLNSNLCQDRRGLALFKTKTSVDDAVARAILVLIEVDVIFGSEIWFSDI